jgi:hypothetical protein
MLIQKKFKKFSLWCIDVSHIPISITKLIQNKTLRVFKKYAVNMDFLKKSSDF